ncbi:MAG TPA: ATP-binding protein [Gemmatimonadaceae bacterium]|nr:ATP-binding protein [Gemmatimonadaceae bacterium]
MASIDSAERIHTSPVALGTGSQARLADSVPNQVWTARPDGSLDYVNARVLEYFGRTFEAMVGEGWKNVIHPADLSRVMDSWARSLRTGEPYEVEFRLRRADGEYHWHIGRAMPERDADGRVIKWYGSNTDVEDLRAAEVARDRALAEAKAQRQQMYDVLMQVPAAVTVLEGPDHVFTVVNPLYARLTGHRTLLGKPIRDAMPELEGQGYFDILNTVYATGRPFRAREALVQLDRDQDGVPEKIFLDFVYQPLKRAEGQTFGIMVHAVDVTDKVKAREEIATARAEADHANRAKSEFLAAMSHDLRTPLNAIGGYADLVKDGLYGPVTDAQVNAMLRIRRAEEHLLTLINDILSYAKIEAGRLTIELTDVPVNEMLAELRMLIAPQVAAKGLAYEFRPGPTDLRIRADRERATQIMLNLLTNAVKFTTEGKITVDFEVTNGDVIIRVSDTGPGIAPDRMATIFDPFVQAGRFGEPRREGVGLGLAISRELARAMGGDLAAVSELGHGSTFTVRLPRAVD